MIERDGLDDLNFRFNQSAMFDVGMSQADIVTALRHDGEYFIQFYLGEDLEFPVPDFHVTSWEYLTNPEAPKVAVALPRGHAKTTLSKLAAVWYLLFTDVRFIVYVSNTHTIAAEACKDIINFIKSDNHRAVFGDTTFDVEQDARGFYKFTMRIKDSEGNIKEKFCILKALGAGQQIRGMNIDNTRPELAIVDDLEDDDNTATPQLMKKLVKWFYGPFIKALSKKNHKIIFLGNMLSNKSLLYHFCEKSEEWFSLRFGCLLSDGTPLWPDMWSLEDIRRDFIEYQKLNLIGTWFAEMMNMPMSDEQALIQADEIYYVPIILPEEVEAAFITVDPAISQKTWADETAIVVHALKEGVWRVVEYSVGRYTPDLIFAFVVGFCNKWRTRAVGIEAAGYQTALKYLFEVLMAVKQQHFSICEIPHKNRPKVERIAGWCAMIRKKQWALTEGEYAITEQLMQFDPVKKANRDDLIDAASMCITMSQMYMPTIMENYQHALVPANVTYVNTV